MARRGDFHGATAGGDGFWRIGECGRKPAERGSGTKAIHRFIIDRRRVCGRESRG